LLQAQFADYWNFSASQAQYEEITGGTILGTAVVGSVGAASLDDVLYTLPDGSIPFPFSVNNVVYSGLTISSNAQVIFGGTTYLGHIPLSSTIAAGAGVAVLARDLQGLVTEGTLGEMRYQVIGNAPSREFVIQWKNFKKYGTANNNENYNFQLRLQEGSNRIRITYGSMTVNTTNGSPQVGIRGSNNTEYVGRTTTTDWAATTAATVNTATCTLTTTVFPASGLCMNFLPYSPDNPPNPATIVSPANAATQVSPYTFLNWASGGGLPSGYRLSLGTNNPPTNVVNNLDLGAVTSYNPEPDLAFATTYYWQVIPYNQIGSALNCPVWSFTTHADTSIQLLPYPQNFDAVTAPALPLGWSSIYQATVTTGYVKTVTTSPQSTPNCVAMYNPTDINTLALLIAPPLHNTIPTNSVRVVFWGKGATTYSVKVGVMTNPTDAATFTEIQTVTLSAAWAQYSIPLNSYAGTGKFIAFKHASSAAAQTLYLDTVLFEEIAANDLAALSIAGSTSPSVNSSTTYTVSVYNNGTASQNVYSVKIFNSQGTELATAAGITIAAGAQVAVPVVWTPTIEGAQTIYGKVVLPGDANPTNDQTPNMSVNVMPEGMITITVGTGNTTARMPIDMYYHNSVYQTIYYPDEMGMIGNIISLSLFNNFVTTTLQNKPTKIWMATTQLADLSAGWVPSSQMTLVFDGTMTYPGGQNTITFPLIAPFQYTGGNLLVMWNRPNDTAYYSSSDFFKCQTVGTNRARNIYSDTTVYNPNNMTGGTLTGSFPMTTFVLTPMGGDPNFMVSPASYNFVDVTAGGSRSTTFTVRNVGGGSLGINDISLDGNTTFALSNVPTLPAALTTGQSLSFVLTYSPSTLGNHAATITITDNLGTRQVISHRTNHTIPITGNCVNDVTIGDGTQTARYPIDMYYKNSLYETLIYPNEMSNFIGQITGIKLYNNFTTTTLQNKPTKIWIGTTTLPNLANGWIPSTQLTQVFNGTVNYPSGQHVITIDFPQPYMYLNGENLVFLFNRPMDTAFFSSTDYFKCQTVGTNRARYIFSDTVEYDPAAPTGGTLTGQFPKITLSVIPGGVGHLNGTVLGEGNLPLAGVSVRLTATSHSTTTNASGQYNIINILPNTYSISFSKFGYTTHTQNLNIIEGQTETLNITLVPMASVSLGGIILASDTAAGLANATLSFEGYQNYTTTTLANGTFTLPSVYAGQSYTYTVSCAGYMNATGSVSVGAVNHTMPPITLNELAFAPYGVVAALNQAQTQAELSWYAPDPNAVSVTESFEAASFPPANWTRIINNTGPLTDNGILPTWSSFGTTTYYSYPAVPTDGTKQAGIGFTYTHQDEWLISHSFACPPAATLSFTTFVYRGSVQGDHYYVKVSQNGGQDWTVLWDATTLSGGYTTVATPYSINMQAYGGQQIKIAFHARDPLTGPNANLGLWYDWFIDKIVIGNTMKSLSLVPQEMIKNGLSSSSANKGNRALTGYQIWRLRAGQEANESQWTLVTPQVINTLTHNDTAWNTLSNGTYRWAVKAIYTNGVASLPVLSNSLQREVLSGTIQGMVRKPNNQALSGATVSAGGNFTTTNSSGLYSLSLPVGVYSVSCSAPGYQTNTVNNVTIIANQSITQNFNMLISANEDELIPVTATVLNGNYPNPFNPETTISYAIKETGEVSLEVYNLKGQKVRSLVNGRQNTGHYRIVFNGKDDLGQALSSGIYFYRFTAGSYTSTRKMILME
jgi:hypothetical protein